MTSQDNSAQAEEQMVLDQLRDILAHIEDLAPENATEIQKKGLEIAGKVITGKQTLTEAVGWGPEEVEGFYGIGYNLFNSGRYEDAQNVFAICQALYPYEFRYMFSLATCFQKREQYSDAAVLYLLSAGLDQDNPAPFLRIAECSQALGRKDAVLEMAEQALATGTDRAEYAAIHERARIMKENAE